MPAGELDVELSPTSGTARPVRLIFTADAMHVISGKDDLKLGGSFSPGNAFRFTITADAEAGTFSLGDERVGNKATFKFAEPADSLARLTFRTGSSRPMSELATVAVENDKPIAASTFRISKVEIR